VFVLLFLPICLIGYFALNHYKQYRLAQVFLFGMSLWFYGYFKPTYLLVILSSILLNFGVYLWMAKVADTGKRKALMIFGVSANVAILLYFKYLDFIIGNTNAVFGTEFTLLHITLPLGISFFTFQQISFIVDAYRREVPKYDFWCYASFVSYFPQLIAGPIVTHDELVPQFLDEKKKTLDTDNLARGLYLFALGLAKKVLIADNFGNIVNYGYAIVDGLNTTGALLTMISYTIQIYFDFSGYCDMATGVAKMMNIDLPQNFNSPYKARTIVEFWDRWHMTLTRFFTRYVYIPLGGNRQGKARTYLNIFIVFLISGFWHGASWSFVFWGVMHGVFSLITRIFKRFFNWLHPAVNWLLTFTFVNVAWVFFRAEKFSHALTLLKKIFAFNFGPLAPGFMELEGLPEVVEVLDKLKLDTVFAPIGVVLLLVVAFVLMLGSKNAYEKMLAFKPTVVRLITTLILLVWSVISFAGISTFLYFNF
jgi:alginate O-acetyltransferase complex protein AlgI